MFAEVRASYLRALSFGVLLIVVSPFTASSAGPASPFPKTSPAQKAQIVENYGKLPLSFEANAGQADKSVKFLSRGSGYGLYLTRDEAVLTLRNPVARAVRFALQGKLHRLAESAEFEPADVVRMQLAGASGKAEPTGEEPLPGTANYFIGNDPSKWHTGVPTYAKVRYTGIYHGVDLVYYGNQRQIEYDFVVAPGADPKSVRLQFSGAKELHLAANGDVVVTTANGSLTLHKPLVYQIVDGNRHSIAGSFALAKRTVGFRLGSYNHAKELVIDPVLAYSTYLGGSGGDAGNAIAVDSAGYVYVAGQTSSTNFPVTTGAFQTTNHATVNGLNAFVTKLNPTGTALVYSSYLGGSGSNNGGDQASGLAVDSSGNAYITGSTYSTDFPVTQGAFQTTNKAAANGDANAFVTKLNPTGTALVYSTYLGGSGLSSITPYSGDKANAIAVDALDDAYVTGKTYSTDFPVTQGAYQTTNHGAANDCANVFISKLNPAGTALGYSTYLGGSGGNKLGISGDIANAIAVDAAGDAYVGGQAGSADFPATPGAFQTTNKAVANQSTNAFIAELNPAGTTLVYSTYLGGSGGDTGNAIALDPAGDLYVAGQTASADFPVTSGAFQTTNHGTAGKYDVPNAFVTELNPAGTALVYSTYLGGSGGIINVSPTLMAAGGDQVSGLAIDSSGNAYVTGSTASADFPVTQGAYQTTNNDQPGCAGGCIGGYNALITELNSIGSALVYSTFLGGDGINPYDTVGIIVFGSGDQANALALDSSGNIYVTGLASSSDFPVTSGAFQTTIRSPQSAFVTKLNMGATSTATTPTVTVTPALTSITSGQVLPVTISVSGASGSPTPTGTVTLASGTYSSAAATLSAGSATIDVPAGALLGEPYPYNALSPDLLAANYLPDAASSSTYNFASGLASVQVLAAVVWVTPSLSSINLSEAQSQPISLAMVVTSGPGYPTPTGTVTLTDGSYTSAAATLTGGDATITVPAGTMTTGFNINLIANYLGDDNYAAVSEPAMVYVNAGTLLVSVVPSATSVTQAQALTVSITVSAGSGNPTPTGTVMLFGNGYYSTAGYSSASTALTNGSATITIPAGSLPVGIDSLQAYFDDATTGSVDAIGIAPVTVTNSSGPSFTITGTAVTLKAGATTGNTSTITVTPSGGFTGSVALTAAITSSPSGAQDLPTLSFGSTSPVNIAGPTAGTATLTITTTAAVGCTQASQMQRGAPWYTGGGAGLICVLLFGVSARRRSWRTVLGMLLLLLALAAGFTACGSGSSTCNSRTSGTTPGTYTITITGSSGAAAATGTVTLTVQ
jgi:hypothetical protein